MAVGGPGFHPQHLKESRKKEKRKTDVGGS
jgi:hypothetical protein